jgi:hypothetical protein
MPITQACAVEPPAAVAAPHGPTRFVLGVWVQPIGSMDAWKARGINTLVEVPQGHDPVAWAKAAGGKGLYQIRRPAGDLASDLKDDHLLAWATDDEPSNTTVGRVDYGSVAHDHADLVKQAAPWRAAAKAAGRFVPIWTNHVGPHIYPDWARNNALMQDYMRGPASDWLASDSYPIEDHKPLVMQSGEGYASSVQGVALDRQRAWSGGKPVMSFIGTSPFADGSGVPTVGEFNAMAWSSVIHGAAGIIYFPVRFSPAWSFDATPPELVGAITRFDRQIAAMNDVLMDAGAGGRRPFKLFRSADAGARPAADQLPYPFEAAEIATAHGPYRIILNLTPQDQVLDKPEWGLKQAAFSPYGLRTGLGAATTPAPTGGGAEGCK